MAELSTVARPYAEALFAVAQSTDLSKTHAELDVLASLAANSEVQAWVKAPAASSGQTLNALLDMAVAANHQTPFSTTTSNLLAALIDNKRVSLLPEIAKQFSVLKNKAESVKDAHIVSAFELTDAQLLELTTSLEKKFSTKLKPIVTVDSALIGGVRVSVGDEVLDASVQAQLEQMRVSMMA